nr:hypothetical protein [Tanacetum cinerariifolium]
MNSSTIVSRILHTNSHGKTKLFQFLKVVLKQQLKAIKRLKQGESINVQDLETNLYWEFGKFTSRDVNVQFLLQLQPEWQRFMTLVKQSQELKTVSYHKLYDILKQYQNEVNELRAERISQAHYMYMAQIQEVTPDAAADSGAIFDTGPLQKVSNDDNYNVFAIKSEHPEQSKSIHDTYPIKQDEHNVIINSLDMSYDREQIDQNDDDDDLANKQMKKELSAHQETISILLQAKEAQIKLYKTREEKELDKVIALENKVKVLDNIVYKTGQSVQTMNMLNCNCKTSFAKPEFLKKAQRSNPRLYDIGVIPSTSVSRPQLKSNQMEDRVMLNNSQEKKQEVEDHQLSKSKMMSKSFETLQKHAINLELELRQCKEKMRNDKSFKINPSKEFCKEREQYFEIQDLKARLQDNGIVISELKKLIEKLKGKSVDTKFQKSLVIRQPNAFKSQRPSILGKSTVFSDSLERKYFSKSKSVTQKNVSNDFSKPVTAQILPPNKKFILKNTNVLAPGMYKLHTEPTQTRTSQLPHDSRKSNKRVSFSTGVIPTTSVSRPKLKSNPMEDRVLLNNSQGNKPEVEDHHRNFKFFKNKMLDSYPTIINCSLLARIPRCSELIVGCGIARSNNRSQERHHDLKAQLQDKGISISELKKLIEKLKGKYMDTKFEKSSVNRKPNAFKSQRPSILGKPTIFSDSLERKDFSKSKSVTKNNMLNDFSKPVIAQILPPNMKSILKNKKEVEDHRRNVKFSKNKTSVTACNDNVNAKTLNVNFVCATCGKCMLNAKHDMCVLKSHNGVNSRTKMPMAMPVSSREPKRIINQSVAQPLRETVASESTNQKPRHTNRKLYENVSKTCSWWYPKFTPPGYKWEPKSQIGNVNQNVIMPLGNASRTINILEPMTSRRSTVSNTPLSSNSFAARRDYPIHHRL